MNNAKIWLVVKPTVGVPLFLTAVALGSFSVHVAVLRNSTWVGKFLEGKSKAKTAALEVPSAAPTGSTAVVVFNGAGSGTVDKAQEATIILPDGRTGKVIFASNPAAPTTTAMITADQLTAK